MRHTSETVQGQIYIPSVNWLLCVGTIIFVLVFKDLAQLTNAYGYVSDRDSSSFILTLTPVSPSRPSCLSRRP
jgi:hypothetical protein